MEKYYYGVGRVRALEARFASPLQIERMASAPDFESAFNVLNETPYAETFPHLRHPFDYEEMFEIERASLEKLMLRLAPKDEIIQALIREDYALLEKASSPLIRQLAYLKIELEKIRAQLRKGETPKPSIEFNFLDLSLPIQLIEKAIDDYITGKFRKAKYVNSGVEPLVGFYLAKKAEIKTLRFILICKQNYIETEQIKERLRVSY
jgi:vacuolar-type H+-ATPase subunit C/Vma6